MKVIEINLVNPRPLFSTPSTFNRIATALTRPCVAAVESGDWPATQIFTSIPGTANSRCRVTVSSLVTAWCNDVDGLECLRQPPTKFISMSFSAKSLSVI